MAEKKGSRSPIFDPFSNQSEPKLSQQGSGSTSSNRRPDVRIPDNEEEVAESSVTSVTSGPAVSQRVLGLRTSLDNLNFGQSSDTSAAGHLGGEEPEPHTPPERILSENRRREAPGAPKKPRRPFDYDKGALARVSKKLDFD